MTNGSVEPLKQLHREFGDRVQFVDVLIRQAHPGPDVPPYQSEADKLHDAERYLRHAGYSWPVLADDLAGTVHQTYSGLADPTYLIDAAGRVAFVSMWTGASYLYEAIEALLGQGGRGIVHGGWDRAPHLGPALTDGWRGIALGLPRSVVDLELASPGMSPALWLGYRLKRLLAPLTLRARPLPAAVRLALTAGAFITAVLGLTLILGRGHRSR